MSRLNGNLVGFKIGSSFIECELSCSINLEADMLPASVDTDGGWRGYIYGDRGWSATVNGNMLKAVSSKDGELLINAILNKEVIQVEMATSDAKFRIYGNALVGSANIDANSGEDVSFGGQLTGDGKLNFARI